MLADPVAPSWADLLDELERGIGAAMAGTAPAWVPPVGIGPIPAELEDRARVILEAQGEAIVRMVHSQKVTMKHLQAVESVPDGQKYPGKRGLDVIG